MTQYPFADRYNVHVDENIASRIRHVAAVLAEITDHIKIHVGADAFIEAESISR